MSLRNVISMMGTSGVVLDPDAQAFLTASDNMGNATIVSAIDNFVIDLKAANLWTKMKALYPFVGGTANKHKWNLADPQDTDAANRIVWTAPVTHDANGVTVSAGSSAGIGDTKFYAGLEYSNHSIAIGIYVKTIGSSTSSTNSIAGVDVTGSRLWFRRSASTPFDDMNGFMGDNNMTGDNNVLTGFFSMSHTVTTNTGSCFFYHGGTQIQSVSYSMPGLTTTTSIGVGRVNGRISNGATISLQYMSTGLTGAEVASLNTAVAALQTALGR